MPPKKRPTDADLSEPSCVLLLKLVNKITDLLDQNYRLSLEVNELKVKQHSADERQNLLLKRIEDLENGKSGWIPSSNNSTENVQAIVSSVSDELAERKDKELNLVIYGLKEDASQDRPNTDPDTRQQVSSLFENGLKCDVPYHDIDRAFRLGRPRPPGEKPRPVKVFLRSPTARQKVLDSCKSLGKLPPSNSLRNVFIRPDLTKLQRQADFTRRQQSKQNPDRHHPMANKQVSSNKQVTSDKPMTIPPFPRMDASNSSPCLPPRPSTSPRSPKSPDSLTQIQREVLRINNEHHNTQESPTPSDE